MRTFNNLKCVVLLGFTLFLFPVGRVLADNLALDICTSCTTVAAFQSYAEQNIPAGAYRSIGGGAVSV